MKLKTLTGLITEDGYVIIKDGRRFLIDRRGTDDEGYPEVLIDAKIIGGSGSWHRQSIKPYIGMKCRFMSINTVNGFNFEIIK